MNPWDMSGSALEAHRNRDHGQIIRSRKARSGRPIGHRVIQAMEILERLGEANYMQVWEQMHDGCCRHNASKYMARSVEYGLAERIGGNPVKYRPVQQWRRWLTEAPVSARAKHGKPAKPRISSVWDLGGTIAKKVAST